MSELSKGTIQPSIQPADWTWLLTSLMDIHGNIWWDHLRLIDWKLSESGRVGVKATGVKKAFPGITSFNQWTMIGKIPFFFFLSFVCISRESVRFARCQYYFWFMPFFLFNSIYACQQPSKVSSKVSLREATTAQIPDPGDMQRYSFGFYVFL